MTKKYYIFFILILSFTFSNAQRKLVDEWEANIGYLNFQGDYGTRGLFRTTLPNYGGMLGGKIYFNLLDPDRTDCYACQHIRFMTGLNMGYSFLSFSGIEYEYPKLKAINGQIYFINMNISTEYHINNLRFIDYFSSSFFNKLDPYVGAGIGFMAYHVVVKSDLGNYEKDPSILPTEFIGGMFPGSGIVPSLHLEVGLRYRFTKKLMFNFNNKWIYFLSDKVDGVVPNAELTDNRYNDWMFSPSLGVVVFVW